MYICVKKLRCKLFHSLLLLYHSVNSLSENQRLYLYFLKDQAPQMKASHFPSFLQHPRAQPNLNTTNHSIRGGLWHFRYTEEKWKYLKVNQVSEVTAKVRLYLKRETKIHIYVFRTQLLSPSDDVPQKGTGWWKKEGENKANDRKHLCARAPIRGKLFFVLKPNVL